MQKFTRKIAVIGFGNMGKALVAGLIKSGNFKKGDVVVSNRDADNRAAAKKAEIIILAVKPDCLPGVLNDLKSGLVKGQLLVSIAAKTTLGEIRGCLGFDFPVVRVMPNICAAVGESMSCWSKSREVTPLQIKKVKLILKSIGEEIMISDENLLSAITVVSGSGPAFFLYLAELFFEFAEKSGLGPKMAKKLIDQTFLGTAIMSSRSADSVQTLRHKIASKGGTTEAVLKTLEEEKFGEIFLKALRAGHKRASGEKS
jgi:pyrroline-5-carboxylate reductase